MTGENEFKGDVGQDYNGVLDLSSVLYSYFLKGKEGIQLCSRQISNFLLESSSARNHILDGPLPHKNRTVSISIICNEFNFDQLTAESRTFIFLLATSSLIKK